MDNSILDNDVNRRFKAKLEEARSILWQEINKEYNTFDFCYKSLVNWKGANALSQEVISGLDNCLYGDMGLEKLIKDSDKALNNLIDFTDKIYQRSNR